MRNQDIDHIGNHHEAGHAAIMHVCKIPVIGFRRNSNGSAEVLTDPNVKPHSVEDYYKRFLTFRASRFSQPLSQFNSPDAEAIAFQSDDERLEQISRHFETTFSKLWNASIPTYEEFHDQLIQIADDELGVLFALDSFEQFVRCIANGFDGKPWIGEADINELIEQSWSEAKCAVRLSQYQSFFDACSRDVD